MGRTLEIVRFKLKDGVSDDQFATESRKVEANFVSQQPGFIDREAARNADEVTVVLHWNRPEDAEGCWDKFPDAPESRDYNALIETETFTMTRYEVV